MLPDCPECKRLEAELERAAISCYEMESYARKLSETDKEKLWATRAAQSARTAMDEWQRLLNEHSAKHAAVTESQER